jgi:hypothetical protein
VSKIYKPETKTEMTFEHFSIIKSACVEQSSLLQEVQGAGHPLGTDMKGAGYFEMAHKLEDILKYINEQGNYDNLQSHPQYPNEEKELFYPEETLEKDVYGRKRWFELVKALWAENSHLRFALTQMSSDVVGALKYEKQLISRIEQMRKRAVKGNKN